MLISNVPFTFVVVTYYQQNQLHTVHAPKSGSDRLLRQVPTTRNIRRQLKNGTRSATAPSNPRVSLLVHRVLSSTCSTIATIISLDKGCDLQINKRNWIYYSDFDELKVSVFGSCAGV